MWDMLVKRVLVRVHFYVDSVSQGSFFFLFIVASKFGIWLSRCH